MVLEPALVRLYAQGPDQAHAAGGVRKDAYYPSSPAQFLVEPFQHVGALQVLVMLARQAVEGQGAAKESNYSAGLMLPGIIYGRLAVVRAYEHDVEAHDLSLVLVEQLGKRFLGGIRGSGKERRIGGKLVQG